MELSHVNWIAVIVAALSNFLLGGLWYSRFLFGKSWQKENRITDDELKEANSARIFGTSFLWSVVMAFTMAYLLNDSSADYLKGIRMGMIVGCGWVASGIFIIGLFELRSTRYMLINAGYMVLSLILMGSILGAWR